MPLLGVLDQEMMTPRDMNKATIGQSGNRDIPGSKCGISVYSESRGQGRDAIHPTSEIGIYISRENIL